MDKSTRIKIDCIKKTVIVMSFFAFVVLLVFLVGEYGGLVFDQLEKVPTEAWIGLCVLGFACLLYSLILHLWMPPDAMWVERRTEQKPDCKYIHVRVKRKDGDTMVRFRVKPEKVNFSDNAAEKVLQYMIVE